MPGPAPRPMPRILRDSSLYFAGNIASRAMGFLMLPFYGRHLLPAQYGILSLVELSTTVVAIVFGLQSIGQTLTRIYHDQAEETERRRAVSTALIAAIAGAVSAACLAILFAHPIARAIALPEHANLLRAAFTAMVFSTVAEVVLVHERIRGRARFFLAYSLTILMTTVAANIWFIGHEHLGVWGFVTSKLIVTGAGSLFLVTRAFRELGIHWSAGQARAMARFGWPLIASSAAYYAIHFSDRLFLAHVNRAELGVYTMAYNFAFLLSIVVGDSFAKSWGVSFYAYAGAEGWQARFMRIGTWLFFVLAVAATGIALFGRDMLAILVPASYAPPILMLPVLVFGYYFREIGDFFRNMLLIGAGSGRVGWVAGVSALLNLALNAVLISGPLRMGIWGAALATGITWLVYCVICWVTAARMHRVTFSAWPLLRLTSAACLVLAAHTAIRAANPYGQIALDMVWLAAFLALAAMTYLDRSHRLDASRAARGVWESRFRRVSGTPRDQAPHAALLVAEGKN